MTQSQLRKLESIDALLDFCRYVEKTQTASQAARTMCTVYAECEEVQQLKQLDPFSKDYASAARLLYQVIANVDGYDPWVNERTPFIDLSRTVSCPMPYKYGDSVTVADFMLSWGWILRVMEVSAGAKVLEYGAGEGQLAITLARMGCEVSIIDIDERYLHAVQAQCKSLGISIYTQHGEFGDAMAGKMFDRIVFYEAFHHSFDHAVLLDKLRQMLAPGGFILFAGEPIVEPSNPCVPFAWGPRLDGLSVRSSRQFGWCELAFQRPYFAERLMRSGFTCQYNPCPVTGRGDCYVARPICSPLRLSESFDISVHGQDAGWHSPEATHRWTKYRALLPVPEFAATVEIKLVNFLPVKRVVDLCSESNKQKCTIKPMKRATMHVPAAGRLIISTDTTPAGIEDPRDLGVAVESVTFR